MTESAFEAGSGDAGSAASLLAMCEDSTDLIGVFAPDGTIRYLNPAARRFFGVRPQRVGACNVAELQPGDQAAELRAAARVAASGEQWRAPLLLRAASGEQVRVSVSIVAHRDRSGALVAFSVAARDLSDLSAPLVDATRSNPQLSAIVECSDDVTAIVGPDARVRFVSPNVERVLGIPAEQVLGADSTRWVTDGDLTDVTDTFRRTIGGNGSGLVRFRVEDPNAVVRTVEAAFTDRTDDPQVGGVVLNIRDVTEREGIEQALHDSEARFRALADACPVGVYLLDEDGHRLYANHRWQEIVGLSDAEVVEREWGSEIHPDDAERVHSEGRAMIGARRAYHSQHRIVRKDGEVRWIDARARPITERGELRYVGTIEDITEVKQLEEELRASRREFQVMADSSPVGIFHVDEHGRHVYGNPKWHEINALERPVPEGAEWGPSVHPDDRDRVAEAALRAYELGAPMSLRHRIVRRDGERWVRSQASVLFEGDRFRGWVGTIEDITDELESRHQADRLLSILEATPDLAAITDPRGRLLYLNRAARSMLGVAADTDLAELDGAAFLDPAWFPRVEREAEAARDRTGEFRTETVIRAADGREVPVSLVGTVHHDEQGEPEYLSVLARDISDLRAFEQRLRESEAWFRSLLQHATDVVTVHDARGRLVHLSPSATAVLGWTTDDIARRDLFDLVHPDDHDDVRAAIRTIAELPNEPARVEFRVRSSDGQWRDLEARSTNLLDDPVVRGVVTNATDVTERKQAERALARSEGALRALVQHAPLAIGLLDRDGTVRFWSRASEELFGWRADELVGRAPAPDFVPPEEREAFEATMQRVLEGQAVEVEGRRRHRDGTLIDVAIHAGPLRDAVGRVTSIIMVGADITDRRRAEDALRRSEERFRTLVQSSADLTMVRDVEGVVRYVSPSAADFFGVGDEGMRPDPEVVHPDDLERVRAEFASLRATPAASRRLEFRMRRADGEWRWLDTVATNQLHNLSVEGIVTNAFDVTERVEALARLAEANEQLHQSIETLGALVESSPLAIVVIDRDGRVEHWNPAAEELYGWPPGDVVGAPDPTVPPELADELERVRARASRGESVIGVQTRRRRRDGETVDVSLSVAPIRDDDGTASSWMVVAADVTERVRAEAAVRAQDERFRSLVQNTTDVITVVDADGTVRYATPATERVFGYREAEAVGLNVFDLVHPDDLEHSMELFRDRVDDGGQGSATEHRIRAKDGSWRLVETIAVNLLGDPAVRGVVLTTRDISERKESEEALRRSEERFRALVQHAADVICVVAPDGAVKYLSPSVTRVFGSDTDFDRYDDPWDRIHPEDLPRVLERFSALAAHGERFSSVEYRVRNSDGTWRIVESVAEDLRGDPAVEGIVIWSRDVTEREQAAVALRSSEARYRGIVEDQTELICRWRQDGTITFANEAANRYLGRVGEPLEAVSIYELIPGESKLVLRREMQRTGTGRVSESELPVKLVDGTTRWVRWTVRALGSGDTAEEYQAVGIDVTERRAAEHLAEEQARILELVARGTPQLEVFDALCRLLEERIPHARGAILLIDEDSGGLLHAAAPNVPPEIVRFLDELSRDPESPDPQSLLGRYSYLDPRATARLVRPEVPERVGVHGVVSACIFPMRSPGSDETHGAVAVYLTEPVEPTERERAVGGAVANLASIAVERTRAEAELSHQALHDPLTGLPNRALFEDRLGQALARSRRTHGTCAVLFLDLDRFKTVNDSLGHDTGDDLLRAVARRLEAVARPGETVARFGGDEFTVLCEDLGDAHREAEAMAEQILDVIARPFRLGGNEEVFLTTSIGIAFGRDERNRPKTLLRDADAAMYRAKERGKARFEVFDEAMRARAVERLETESALHRALERGEFEVFYQPIISLTEARCVGAEALVRWRHPERGLVTPAEFIALAEETGLIVQLGAWVLEEACDRAARWQTLFAGDSGEPFIVTVNLSARQLLNPGLVDQVAVAIERSGVDPRCLSLEITENVLMDDSEATMRALEQLDELGVLLGVDDFGTGYSSLEYLKRLPVGLVKVDRSFVDGLGRDREDSAIVTAVVSLADALGLRVVAEGVETNDQLSELLAIGCDLAQGYLFSPPQPAGDLETLLGRGSRWRPPGSALMHSLGSLQSARRRRGHA